MTLPCPQIGNIKPETEIEWYKDKVNIHADDEDSKKIEMKDGLLTFNIGKVRPSGETSSIFFIVLIFACFFLCLQETRRRSPIESATRSYASQKAALLPLKIHCRVTCFNAATLSLSGTHS